MAEEVKWIKISVNMFSDDKIKQIRSLPDGNAVLLIWVQLLLLAGRINHEGMLVVSNTEIAYTEEMMATAFDMPLKTVIMALSTFKNFGMVELIDDVYHITNWAKHQALEGMEKIRERDKERKREARAKAKAITSADAVPALPEPQPIEVVAQLPLVKAGEFHPITKDDVRMYADLYPGIDVMQEIRKMIGWCDANPKNRKTKTGAKRFINSWLSRAQDRAPRQSYQSAPPPDGARSLASRGLEDWD